MDPEALKNLTPQQKEEIMVQVQQQVALAHMQVLYSQLGIKCHGFVGHRSSSYFCTRQNLNPRLAVYV